MIDRRERPWRKLRVVVEVSVPPTSRASERDLIYHVRDNMPGEIAMPRAIHRDARKCAVRVKSFSSFLPAYLRVERGMKPRTKKKENTDDHGL